MLASALASGASVVSADVPLDSSEAVIGSFTAGGLTYSVTPDGLMLVAVDASAVSDGILSIPESVVYDGMTYPVTAVGPYALYLSGAASVELPATITGVDELAFRSSDVQWVDIDPDNDTFATYDGILYDATFSRLLLIPGGRQGAVRIDSHAEEVPSSAFSHCAGVMAISVDAGGAAYSSWDGLLYDASGSTLLRVPAGAVDITIREGCATIASGAMAGCAKLERINAPSTVTSISPDVFESVPTISLPARVLQDESAAALLAGAESALADNPFVAERSPQQLTAMVALSAVDDDLPEPNLASIEVNLSGKVGQEAWQSSGFTVAINEEPKEADPMVDVLSQAETKAATYYTVVVHSNGHVLKWEYCSYNLNTQNVQCVFNSGTLGASNNMSVSGITQWLTVVSAINLDFGDRNTAGVAGCYDFYQFTSGTPGWSLNGFSYSAGGSPINTTSTAVWPNRNATVYALWRANTYKVTLNVNGGSGGSGSVTATYDSAMPSMTKPTRAGFTFQGYYDTSASTGGTQYYTAAGASARTWNKPNNATLYARWSGNTITCSWNSQGGSSVANTAATYSATAKVPMPSANPTKAGYVFAGWWTAADGGTEVTGETALPTSNPTYHAHWTSAVSADVPLEVTARVDRLGLQEQAEASGYIESRSGAALDVTDAEFEPLAGAATLFGTDAGSVSLVGFPGTSTTPLFTFSLDVAGDESNAGALSPLTMASYGTRIPIRYRFDIPDELLPALAETTLPVCQVSYTVALA